MRITKSILLILVVLATAGCRSNRDFTVIEGEAARLIDFPVDPTISFVGTVTEFVDIHDSTGATYRGLFMPEMEYISLDGTMSIIHDDSILENGRTYKFYVRPRPWATVPEKAKRSFHWVTGITDVIRLSPPPDSARYFDIYKIQQLSDTPLYRRPEQSYQIDLDTT